MQITPMEDSKTFVMTELSFADLKTIRDACAIFGKQGSLPAKELHQKISSLMDEISI